DLVQPRRSRVTNAPLELAGADLEHLVRRRHARLVLDLLPRLDLGDGDEDQDYRGDAGPENLQFVIAVGVIRLFSRLGDEPPHVVDEDGLRQDEEEAGNRQDDVEEEIHVVAEGGYILRQPPALDAVGEDKRAKARR